MALLILGLIILLIIIYAVLAYMPGWPIYSIAHGRRDKNEIAITFDDGPDPDRTPEVLKILHETNVQAAFFMVGQNVIRHPDLVAQVERAGHIIGNHSYTHRYRTIWIPGKTNQEFKLTNNSIQAIIHKQPALYRPPFGGRSLLASRLLKKSGISIIAWDNMTKDYFDLPAEQIINNIAGQVRPGSIIVLHDGHAGLGKTHTNMMQALPQLIRQLQNQGYAIVRLDQLLKIPPYLAE